MQKKRNVFLFGAGAVIDWCAPSTNKITQEILLSGFKTIDNKTTVTQYIYNCLIEAGVFESEINFETLINIIEELIVHYSNSDSVDRIFNSNPIQSLHRIIFESKIKENIFNYSIEGGELKHGFRLEIPKGKTYHFGGNAVNFETPEQMFLQLLLAEIISDIISLIDQYSYNIYQKTNGFKERNIDIDKLFATWIRTINRNDILRMYSLNYDRNFKIILDENEYKIFDGFTYQSIINYSEKFISDVPKIVTDFDIDIYYNLHGCIYWDVEARNIHQLPQPKFFLTPNANLPINNYEHAVWQSERGKTIMLTNIITGYQKTQKGIFPPFKQMQAALDKDCVLADTIFIIGYSFGDEHINSSLRIAFEYNKSLKVTIVDPDFTNKHFDLNVVFKVFSASNSMSIPHSINNKIHEFLNGQVVVYTMTFKEYMSYSITSKFSPSPE